jgi:hypothetical protein
MRFLTPLPYTRRGSKKRRGRRSRRRKRRLIVWRNERWHNYYSGNINFNNPEISRLYPLNLVTKVGRGQGKGLVSDEGRWMEVDCFSAK